MFKTTVYALATVPLKKSNKTGTNSQIDVKVPSGDVKTVEKQRSVCIEQFDKYRKNCGDVRRLDGFLSTENDREKYLTSMINAAEAYAGGLIDLVKRYPKYGIMVYYMWSSSLCDKQEIAYDDYRYDLACVYFNIGATLFNMAHYVLCVRASVGTMGVMEKEAYRILLRAAGYFCTCRSLVEEIKKEPIGMADAPVPLDGAERTLSFLEIVALAQAQEIGTNKAVDADAKGEASTSARLSHQAYTLYQYAKDTAQTVKTHCSEFADISFLVTVKCDVFKARTYNYAASCTLASKPSDALWFIDRATQHMKTVEGYQSKKIKVPFGGDKVVDDCIVTIKRNAERISKINSLVHRAKPATGTVPLPPAQVLAQKTEMRLPAPLPPAALSSSLPPEVLQADETKKPE